MEIDVNNLHHAYLILGSKNDSETLIGDVFATLDIKESGNPDIFIWEGEKFGIDESRVLKSRSESKAFGTKKIFIIKYSQITPEAQNALLKVFEEPTPDTHFFILSKRNYLLPTLLSRLNVINLQSKISETNEAKVFLASSIIERLDFVKKRSSEESFDLSGMLDELIEILIRTKGVGKEVKSTFELSKYADDPAANMRMILEHLALTLPVSLE